MFSHVEGVAMNITDMLEGVDWRPIEALNVVGTEVYATHQGFIQVGDSSLRVFKLSNGERVFDADDIADMLGLTAEEVKEAAGGHRELSDDE